MPAPILITLVDDHTVVRKGLKSLIETMGGYEIVSEFDDGKSFIEHVPLKPEPDIIIMDVAMPKMDGKQTMRWLADKKHIYKVLVLTLDTSERTIIELFRLGVRGYIPKTCTAAELKAAIDNIVQTGYYHNEIMTHALHRDGEETDEDRRNKIAEKVTGRELEFLELVCDEKEYTYDQIATIMKVHKRTVDGYREDLFEKFNLKSKTGLVLFAFKNGLIKNNI
jgi:DNA-binding NarL/FixJ family response regulator